MMWNQIQEKWHQVRERIRQQWGRLTDDDLDTIAGRRDQLIGILQKRYGAAPAEIERQVKAFEDWYTAT